MAVVETAANELLVGLGANAEAPPEREARKARACGKLVIGLAALVEAAWLAAFAYAAYRFI
jgi:hypothetical protein